MLKPRVCRPGISSLLPEALIPVIKDCIIKLAPEDNKIVIRLMEGLVTE